MSILDKLSSLIKAILQDENVLRFKQLEKRIDADELLMSQYKKLLDLQKIMVQNEAKKSNLLEQSQKRYQDQLDILMNHLLMGEYLDVLEVVNNDLQMIKQIILDEISADFE